MTAPKTWRGVVNHYRNCSPQVRDYFEHLPLLAEQFPWDVSLAWMFARVEQAWNTAIYCGVVKIHRAHTQVARSVVDRHHMTRDEFWKLFEQIFGKPVPKELKTLYEEANRTRNRLLHGKTVGDSEKRQAVVDILDYAQKFNEFVNDHGGFRPFSPDLRGFKGRSQPLDRATTRWMLKGIGLTAD